MRKVVLFIAMSLDGYISDKDGKVDWLIGQDSDTESSDSYTEFEKSIDTVIMGWTTYHQVATELSPKQWVYENLHSYVLTHRDYPSTANITFISTDPCLLIKKLKCNDGKNIWICGGADVVRQLMAQNLIDTYYISIIPTILGNGTRLFTECWQEIKLRLVAIRNNNGITELIYEKR